MTDQEAAVLIGQLKEHGLEFRLEPTFPDPEASTNTRGHIRRIEDQRDVFCAPGVDERQAKYATLALFAGSTNSRARRPNPTAPCPCESIALSSRSRN
jgi:hypothetical protein